MKLIDKFEIQYDDFKGFFKIFDTKDNKVISFDNFEFKAVINKKTGKIIITAIKDTLLVNVSIETNNKLLDLKKVYEDIETTLNNY